MYKPIATILISALFSNTALAGDAVEPKESELTHIYVAPFKAADENVRQAELHRIAEELFINELAASKKFVFARSAQQPRVELVLTASVSKSETGYALELLAGAPGAAPNALALSPNASLEALVAEAAKEIGLLKKRRGYVLKREGDRITIARGRRDGIAIGQKYRTKDTHEEFVIESVASETAVGKVLQSSGPAQLDSNKVGAVDIVFVIDTTGSMQNEIDGVIKNCTTFANRLATSGIDSTLGLVTFKGGVDAANGLSARPDVFKSWLIPIKAGGTANETPFYGLERALDFKFRKNAKPVLILITDEPAFDAIFDNCSDRRSIRECMDSKEEEIYGRGGLAQRVLARLRATSTTVFPVTMIDQQGLYRSLAQETGGTFFDLEKSQDFTKLLDALGQKIEGMFEEM